MDGSSACVLFTFFPCAVHAHSGLAHPLGATQNLEYNVPGGKLNRGMSVVDSVEILKGRKLTDDEYFKAALLGWGVEFVSVLAYFFPLPRFRFRSSITRTSHIHDLVLSLASASVSLSPTATIRLAHLQILTRWAFRIAPSLLPRLGRYDGPVHHSPWTAMLVSRRGRELARYQ